MDDHDVRVSSHRHDIDVPDNQAAGKISDDQSSIMKMESKSHNTDETKTARREKSVQFEQAEMELSRSTSELSLEAYCDALDMVGDPTDLNFDVRRKNFRKAQQRQLRESYISAVESFDFTATPEKISLSGDPEVVVLEPTNLGLGYALKDNTARARAHSAGYVPALPTATADEGFADVVLSQKRSVLERRQTWIDNLQMQSTETEDDRRVLEAETRKALVSKVNWVKQNNFYEHTPMDGFAFIVHSTSYIEMAFWYILIIICIVVTVRDLVSLFQQYSGRPTTTSLEVHFNRTVSPPRTTICAVLTPKDWGDVFDYLPDDGTGFLRAQELDMGPGEYVVWMHLQTYNSSDEFLSADTTWHPTTIYAAHAYLSIVSFTEMFEWNFDNETGETQWSPSAEKLNPSNADATVFEDFVQSMKVPMHDVMRKFGREAFKLLVKEHHFYPSDGTGVLNDELKVVFEAEFAMAHLQRLCMFADLQRLRIGSVEDSIRIGLDYGRLPGAANVNALARTLTVDFNGARDISPLKKPHLTAKRGLETRGTLAISAVYETLETDSNGAAKCSPDDNIESCRERCRVAYFSQHCHCHPVSLATAQVPFEAVCTLEKYRDCAKILPNNTDIDRCFKTCLPPCTTFRYFAQVKETLDLPAQTNDFGKRVTSSGLDLDISFETLNYPHFTEEVAVEWQNFVGDFGGVLGMWLGGSFLGVVHVFVLGIRNLIRKRNKRE